MDAAVYLREKDIYIYIYIYIYRERELERERERLKEREKERDFEGGDRDRPRDSRLSTLFFFFSKEAQQACIFQAGAGHHTYTESLTQQLHELHLKHKTSCSAR
jgi:hypothetical protein